MERGDNHMNTLDPKSYDYKLSKLIRFTGMHSICTYDSRARIRIVKRNEDHYVVWARPKKGASKKKPGQWADVRGVPLHAELDFDIIAFYNENVSSRKRPEAKRRKVQRTIQKVYKNIVNGVTSNTLRHSFAMELLIKHNIPEKDVAEMIGTSIPTLRDYYNRYGERKSTDQMRSTGWNRPKPGNPNIGGKG